MKNSKKRKYVLILLIVLLLGLAVGYAAFSDTLKITGTATADGSFNMEFVTASCDITDGVGFDLDASEVVVSADKKTMTVSIVDLAYPGAGAEVSVVIKNNSLIPAKIKSVTPTGIEGNGVILIDGLEQITTSHPRINPLQTCEFTFTVQWDPNATDEIPTGKESCTFELDIEYEQDTESFTGTPSHTK
jgi:hypothetical protein